MKPPARAILARHYRSGRLFQVAWKHGRFTTLECVTATSEPEFLLAPALFDPQINGYAGVDFQQDRVDADALHHAAEALRQDGCPRFFLTLITDDWPRLCARLERLARQRNRHPQLRAAVAGFHLEGPFLSPVQGYRGAHEARWMRPPAPEHLERLRHCAGDAPLLVTLAPELPGALAAIRQAARLGITISLGHTNASARDLANARRAGATGFTHLGNGCPRELDRHDNILWRALSTPGLTCGMIPDGHHVSPALFPLLHRLLPGQIYYTTDAMAAAGEKPGRFTLGALELECGPDQVVRLPGTPYFAGSALRPWQGVQRANAMLGGPWMDAWDRASLAPARFVGATAALRVGESATFCLLDPQAPVSRPPRQTLLGK